jgi:hypothetical protein
MNTFIAIDDTIAQAQEFMNDKGITKELISKAFIADEEWEKKVKNMCTMGITIPKQARVQHYAKFGLLPPVGKGLGRIIQDNITLIRSLKDREFTSSLPMVRFERPLLQCDPIDI